MHANNVLNVTLVTPSVSRGGGGVSESVRLLTAALAEHASLRVKVATLVDEHFTSDRAAFGGSVDGFQMYGPRRYGFAPGLLMHLLRTRPDVVHVHGLWMFHCLAVFVWSLVTGRPYVVTPHGMYEEWILRRSRRLKQVIGALYQDRFLRRAAAVQCLTELESASLASRVSKTVVVPNYVPIDSQERQHPSWWSDDLEGRRVFLFFGRIHEKKGWRELCEGWRLACAHPHFRPRCELVFAGWVDQSDSFETDVSALAALTSNVRYVGPQFGEDRERTMAAAHILLLPSKSEGLPMAILESWAKGIPVMMTDECNLRDGFTVGAAVRVECTPTSIRDALLATLSLSDKDLLAMGENGRSLVARSYSAHSVGRAMRHVYEEAAKRRGAFQ